MYTVNENGGSVFITVVNNNPDIEGTVVVEVNTVPGTADEGICPLCYIEFIMIIIMIS